MLLRRAVVLIVVTLPFGVGGQPRLVIPTEHTDNIYNVIFHPDNIHFASGSADGTSKVWDVRGRQLIYTVNGASPMFSPDGKFLITSGDGITHVYEVASGQQLYEA